MNIPTMATAEHIPVDPPYRGGAPNVLVIVMDDLGFAHLGSYGSDIETPTFDALAQRGLRFTNFHTTAVCSPTRACLLTGRNHHRVGMGMLPDLPTNFPAYTSEFPDSAATMAQILQGEGYATYCVGKWHLVPRDQRATGPYRMWPSGCGFEKYYGFLNGETNQWTPNLVDGHSHIEPPTDPDDGYHVEGDLADHAITYIDELRVSDPNRPFFMWYASGAPHAPHQAPDEWLDKYAGRFDRGWDAWRDETLARQKSLGIVPDDTVLPERPEWIEPWNDIDPPRQRLYARMMEVCAGFISHADHQIGRLLARLDELGELETTVVVMVSDNGASAEGGPNGTYNQLGHYISDDEDDIEDEIAHYDDLGGHRSSGHYPWAWALAGNTPLRRWKRYTFEGGVRDPLIISAPGLAEVAGQLRHQYCHAIDVMPTILDLLDVAIPDHVGGHAQMSVDGTSLRPLFASDTAPEVRTSQYYECWGSRAMYHEGWKAVTNHVNQLTMAERKLIVGSDDFDHDEWELFDTRADFNERHNLAAAEPERLRALIAEWDKAAEVNGVFPLDDGAVNRIMHLRTPWTAHRSSFAYRPGTKVHEVTGPNIAGGFRLVAAFTEGVDAGRPGVLCEQGDWLAGWAWYLSDGEVRWTMAGKGGPHTVAARVPDGTRVLVANGAIRDDGLEVALVADDTEIACRQLGVSVPLAWAPDGAFLTVGYGRPFPVCDDYVPPASAPSSLIDVHINTGPPPPLDLEAEFERIMRHQ